jgi:putative transposase
MSRAVRRAQVERENPTLPLSQQCRLSAVSRSSAYRQPAEVSEAERVIMGLIDRQYLARPYYGSRRTAAWLATHGHVVNRKRVQRLMRGMGLVAIYQRPNTSKAASAHKVYPYLLGGLAIERVNQVWCSDVTPARHGRPEIFNTDQSLPQRRLGAASSPATASPALRRPMMSRSAWTARGAAWPTSSSSGCGAA